MNKENRKLTTILAMDVVSYSSKMAEDDVGTLKLLSERRQIIEKFSKSHGGRIFNTAGDAFMIDFSSPVEAVNAAIKIQKEIFQLNKNLSKEKNLEFRVGINMGDVIIEGENLFGDGVNIAARLEAIAPPGRICISGSVHSLLSNNVQKNIYSKGKQKLKNIKNPVSAFFIETIDGSNVAKDFKVSNARLEKYKLLGAGGLVACLIVGLFLFLFDGKEEINVKLNSIAISPITTGSKEQEKINLAAGLTQDIAASLTRASKKLNIIQLNKCEEDISNISKNTGAKYLINGDIKEAGNNIRVTVNLVDTENLDTVWSDRFDKTFEIDNLFKLQDEIVTNIIDALVGNGDILARDVSKIGLTATSQNLDSYACLNFARVQFFASFTFEHYNKALECLKKSVVDDPQYAEAWQYYMVSSWLGIFNIWSS